MSFTTSASSQTAAQRKAARSILMARLSIGSLSYLSPTLGARKAADVWCRLPKSRRKDHRSVPGTVEHVTTTHGKSLTVERWGNGPLVYLVHGWGSWRGQMGAFVDPLVEAGLGVIAFDSLGHGDSDQGERPGFSNGGELVESFVAVINHYGDAQGVIAHSLGCASACRTLLTTKSTNALSLVSPSPDMSDYGTILSDMLGLSQRSQPLLLQRVEELAHSRLSDFDIGAMCSDTRLPSALVIHDRNDKESPYSVSEKIDSLAPRVRLTSTEGLGHQRILLDPDVVATAVGNVLPR